MTEYNFEEVTIEEKPTIGARIANFVEDHPSVAVVGYGAAYLALIVPICAVFGAFIGKTAGSTLAKELFDAGVRLGYE